MRWLVAPMVVFGLVCTGYAQPNSEETLPRAGSLRKSEVNVRSGPGTQYPILWTYQWPGYPVLVLAEYDNYLKIRDLEGEEGWVFQSMVGQQPTAVVQGQQPVPLYKRAEVDSPMVARLTPGLVVRVEGCEANTCRVTVHLDGTEGFVNQNLLRRIEVK